MEGGSWRRWEVGVMCVESGCDGEWEVGVNGCDE